MWSIIVASYGIGLIIMWADHLNRLWQTRQLHLREARILQRELDPSLIEEFDVSGDGQVTELEYVLAMLRSLELVNMDVVGPILDRFNALDKDGNGVLDRDDLQRLLLRRCDQIESQHSRPRQGCKAAKVIKGRYRNQGSLLRLRRMSRRFIGRTGTFNNQIARTSSSRVEEEEEDATKDATKSTYI